MRKQRVVEFHVVLQGIASVESFGAQMTRVWHFSTVNQTVFLNKKYLYKYSFLVFILAYVFSLVVKFSQVKSVPLDDVSS